MLYAFEFRSGIGGTIVAQFKPNTDEILSPTTVKAATGETWTIAQSGGTPSKLVGLANRGVSRTVLSYASGNFTLTLPLAETPQVGDPVLAFPGCNKTVSTCQNKFGNLVNFRGFPYVPKPETVW